jgi:amidophosphoribosyltransferase
MLKTAAHPEAVRGRRLCVVEDLIVRGTTPAEPESKHCGRPAQASPHEGELPPHRHGCYFRHRFSRQEKLIAHSRTVEEMAAILGLDSLAYLSVEGMLSCVAAHGASDYCTACFTGDYPVLPPPDGIPGKEER